MVEKNLRKGLERKNKSKNSGWIFEDRSFTSGFTRKICLTEENDTKKIETK